jgi:hypothetical protein
MLSERIRIKKQRKFGPFLYKLEQYQKLSNSWTRPLDPKR